jgi:hypothetical protein
MKGLDRRELLKRLGVTAVLLPSRMLRVETQETVPMWVLERRRAAISALRIINTIQLNHFAEHKAFLGLDELPMSPIAAELKNHPLLSSAPTDWASLVPGFRITLETAVGRCAYEVEAREVQEQYYAYRTDNRGLILRCHDLSDSRSGQRTRATEAFETKLRAGGSGWSAFLLRCVNAVVPTVSAMPRGHETCCAGCTVTQCVDAWICIHVCLQAPRRCCNLGYTDCINCCDEVPSNCSCAWDACPPDND